MSYGHSWSPRADVRRTFLFTKQAHRYLWFGGKLASSLSYWIAPCERTPDQGGGFSRRDIGRSGPIRTDNLVLVGHLLYVLSYAPSLMKNP